MGNHNVIFYPSNNPAPPAGSGGIVEATQIATAGQTVFTTVNTITANVEVSVNGIIQNTSTYTTVVGGTTITFNTPLLGGEYVIITIL